MEMSMAAMIVKGIYKKKFLKKNIPMIAVAVAVMSAADFSVAHDFMFSAVLTNTAVEGAIHKNHHTKFVIHSPCTSTSFANGSLVILAAIFAETMVSTMAMIAITALVFRTHASKGSHSIHVVASNARGNAIREKISSGYLSWSNIRSCSPIVLLVSHSIAHQIVAIRTPGNCGT